MGAAFDAVAKALQAGELVCIFPEGGITSTGELRPFRPGIQRIIERTPVTVIPMALRGLWGSFFSRKGGRAMRNPLNLRLFAKLVLAVGEPVAPTQVSLQDLQAQVAALRGDVR